MPRLTDTSFLEAHAVLRKDWVEHDGWAISHLSYMDQRNLHTYFIPKDGLGEELLLTHRRSISKAQPSLPHKAGKSYAAFSAAASQARAVPSTIKLTSADARRRGQNRNRTIRVRMVARPEVDVEMLARALQNFAEAEAKRSHDAMSS